MTYFYTTLHTFNVKSSQFRFNISVCLTTNKDKVCEGNRCIYAHFNTNLHQPCGQWLSCSDRKTFATCSVLSPSWKRGAAKLGCPPCLFLARGALREPCPLPRLQKAASSDSCGRCPVSPAGLSDGAWWLAAGGASLQFCSPGVDWRLRPPAEAWCPGNDAPRWTGEAASVKLNSNYCQINPESNLVFKLTCLDVWFMFECMVVHEMSDHVEMTLTNPNKIAKHCCCYYYYY